MKEPIISPITPPSHEPELKVGIVLAEDQKSELTVCSSGGILNLRTTTSELQMPVKEKIKITTSSGRIVVTKGKDQILNTTERLVLSLIPSPPSRAKKGIKIETITAGRGFHWQKEVSAVFAGALEIIAEAENLIVVNHILLEQYLASVISSEMSATCPAEFAKAQAIVARSWALVFLGNKHPNQPYTICNDDCCQRYQGLTFVRKESYKAIEQCRGEVLLTKAGHITPTYYSKSCGGHTDSAQAIFGLIADGVTPIIDIDNVIDADLTDDNNFKKYLTDPPLAYCSEGVVPKEVLPKYLGSVDEPGDYFRWNNTVSAEVILDNLTNKYGLKDGAKIKDIQFGKRGHSGRILNCRISIVKADGSTEWILLENQFQIRAVFHHQFLFSSAFTPTLEFDAHGYLTQVEMVGAGWGHGVGLCQIGALGMSLQGRSYTDILVHYFPESDLVKAYS